MDFQLSRLVPELINDSVMHALLGRKDSYSIEDAKRLQKRQYTVARYGGLQDIQEGYSAERMLEMVRHRCTYLMRRGSTLNNPHIPQSYFDGWERITQNHASRLRELVAQALETRT